ncbi:MAG: bifunctional hydroxymethylpyrimidine kinase/phosphomethylpyrimidine kinase, partial [Candidatus Caldarchaeum sp.]|nr:bifunctional hydroxymethylpyrimidine kinase/phosphomethylpyrimidine kinase [Candidatus Caldarchaeum sp.]
LKTFAAHGLHGMSAITCITAQNTTTVSAIQPIPAEIVREQIRVVVEDIGVDVVKTGMLFSSEIIEAVADELSKTSSPIVVDPVAVAKSGASLLQEHAVKSLIKHMLPLASVATPNLNEARVLTGIDVKTVEDMVSAAEKISSLGPNAVVVKGGHLQGPKTVDVLYYSGKTFFFEAERVETKNTHGTGCCFASAIASNLAKGYTIPQAVKRAQIFVLEAIKRGLSIGRGFGPVHPTGRTYYMASKMEALNSLREALRMLEDVEQFAELIPESGSNFVAGHEESSDVEDFASIPGRIVRVGSGFKPASEPWFGGSRHVAKAVLTAAKHDPTVASAINIRFDEEILRKIEAAGLSTSSYDRSKEPEEVKRAEGMTVPWGVEEAVKSAGGVPDVIYHRGDVGKEAMALVFGQDPYEVVRKLVKIVGKDGGGVA